MSQRETLGRTVTGTAERSDTLRRRCRPPTRARPTDFCGPTSALPEGPEGGADLGGEQFRFLPGSEVATLVYLVEVDEVRVDLLDPVAGRLEDLAGEGGEGGRQLC